MKRLVRKATITSIASFFKDAGVVKNYDVNDKNIQLYFIGGEEDFTDADERMVNDFIDYNKKRSMEYYDKKDGSKGSNIAHIPGCYVIYRPEGDYYSPFYEELEAVFPGERAQAVELGGKSKSGYKRDFDKIDNGYKFPPITEQGQDDDFDSIERRRFYEDHKEELEDTRQRV